jgi:RNA polymerase sigma-70 factor (ECF subfamily)
MRATLFALLYVLYFKGAMQSTLLLLETPDASLIQRARQGDHRAVSWLYERFQPSIFRYLYYRLGERQAAEDLTSDVFLRMLRSLPQFKLQEASFQAWLFQIARNLAVDHFRQAGRLETLHDTVAAPDSTAEQAERSLTHDQLRQAISRLGDDQREVVLLRFVLSLSIGDVARMLQRSEDAIKGLQRRGLQALRDSLNAVEVSDV